MLTVRPLPDAVGAAILRLLPWYHEAEAKARQAATDLAVAAAKQQVGRAERVIASYRAAGHRLTNR